MQQPPQQLPKNDQNDRDLLRGRLAELLVAHGEAEESDVYPQLRRKDAIDEHEAEHGEEEHAEGHVALLAVLESAVVEGEDFDDLVEELAKVVNHHLTEEELTILNPARDDVAEEARRELGETFAARRNELLEGDAGSLDDVRRIVAKARADGLI